MLVQALTECNVQPFFSCFRPVPRAHRGRPSRPSYSIGGKKPYDADYSARLPPAHLRLLGGDRLRERAVAPAGQQRSSRRRREQRAARGAATRSTSLDDAIASVLQQHGLLAPAGAYANGITVDSTRSFPTTSTCTFTQGNDGQLDATKYFARFALMTFDSDTNERSHRPRHRLARAPTSSGLIRCRARGASSEPVDQPALRGDLDEQQHRRDQLARPRPVVGAVGKAAWARRRRA